MTPADLLITSARIWDGNSRDEEAIAIRDGVVIGRGSNREINGLADDQTRVIDAGGRTVIPGLIDSHLHLVRAGRTWNLEVRWDDLHSLDEALSALREQAEKVGEGHWIGVMGGWHPNQFAARTAPTRDDLDRAVPNNPVFVQRAYAETIINSAAMVAMGWDDDVAPEGRVTAPPDMAALRARLAVDDVDEAMSGTRSLLRELNSLGLTGAIDASGFGITADSYDAFLKLFATGERGFRTRFLVGAATPEDEMTDIRRSVETISIGGDDPFLRHLGAGEVLDYAAHDLEGLAPKNIAEREGALREASSYLAEHGWPVHLHSILDTSIDVVLNAWENVDADLRALRWAICHADQIGAGNLQRVADLGVGITIQNGMSMRGMDCAPSWSAATLSQSPPIKTMLELGIPVAAGTDGTVACAYNPWRCIAWMVTGESVDGAPARIESERLTRDEALRLYTSAGAWFSFEEEDRGTLGEGAYADVAVLSADPLTCPDSELAGIESLLTIVGGEVVHSVIETNRVPT